MKPNINIYRTARLKFNVTTDRAAEILGITEDTLNRCEANGTPTDDVAERMATLYQDPQLIAAHAERISDKNFRPLTNEGHTPCSVASNFVEFLYSANVFKAECSLFPGAGKVIDMITEINLTWSAATFKRENA